jgi:hypothetical protein
MLAYGLVGDKNDGAAAKTENFLRNTSEKKVV